MGVKADVDGLLGSLDTVERSLSDQDEKLSESMDLIDNLNSNLTKVGSRRGFKHVLIHAVKVIESYTDVLQQGQRPANPSREGSG